MEFKAVYEMFHHFQASFKKCFMQLQVDELKSFGLKQSKMVAFLFIKLQRLC